MATSCGRTPPPLDPAVGGMTRREPLHPAVGGVNRPWADRT